MRQHQHAQRAAQSREVDRQVQAMFARSRAFATLPPSEREQIQRNTAAIIGTMAANGLAQGGRADPYAVGLTDGFPPLPGQPTSGGETSPQFTGGVQPGSADAAFGPKEQGDFGTAIATGVGQAGALLRQVNFPAFVAELVQGVFQAVVDASIQQMKAYGELVQSVAMSLNDFRDQNVTENQARDHLVSKFPQFMQIKVGESGPRVGLRDDVDPDEMPDVAASLNMGESFGELDDETIEEKLVPAARNDLARSRQSLLATMLLMGLNRIIVTDGKINAKLRFNFRATDTYQQRATDYDYRNFGTTVAEQNATETSFETGENYSRKGGFWTNETTGESSRWTQASHQRTETPAIYLMGTEDTVTGGELEAKAQLMGEVSLNFRSETFDINQLASADEVFRLERVRAGAGRGAPPPITGNAATNGAGTTATTNPQTSAGATN